MMNFLKKESIFKYLFKIFLLALVYFFSARFGFSLAFTTQQVTLVWPPTGIALAAALIFGYRVLPGIALGAFFANLATNETPLVALGIAIGNSLEALVGSYLLNRVGFDRSLAKVSDVFKFVVYGAIVSTEVSATIGVTSLAFGGIVAWPDFVSVWTVWWFGDLIGAMIVAPVLLVWSGVRGFKLNMKSVFEFLILGAFVFMVSVFVFTNGFPSLFSGHPFEYVIFPFLIWAAYRFGQKGSVLIILLVSAVAIWGALGGSGRYMVAGDPERSLFLLELFLGVAALTFLIFSAAVEERKQSQDAVRGREKRFRALTERSYDAIALINEKGYVIYASPSTKRVIGYEPSEFEGTNGFSSIHPDDIAHTQKQFVDLLRDPTKVAKTEYRMRHKDGRWRWTEGVGVNLLSDPDVGAVVVNYRDITERKELDEVKDEFIAMASHELRTPLSALKWKLESLMEEKEMSGAKFRSSLKELWEANERIIDLANSFLDVSRIELGTFLVEPKEVDVAATVKDAISSLESETKSRKIGVKLEIGKNVPKILADPKFIGVVFQNLISNAARYSKAGGEINVSISRGDGGVRFDVSDQGLGIPKDEQPKVFTKLFRAGNVREMEPTGTGLGLYITRYIVEKSGGKIWFESEEGKGSTFYVWLPTTRRKS